jgi:hypothetical protein
MRRGISCAFLRVFGHSPIGSRMRTPRRRPGGDRADCLGERLSRGVWVGEGLLPAESLGLLNLLDDRLAELFEHLRAGHVQVAERVQGWPDGDSQSGICGGREKRGQSRPTAKTVPRGIRPRNSHRHNGTAHPANQERNTSFERLNLAGMSPFSFGEHHDGMACLQSMQNGLDSFFAEGSVDGYGVEGADEWTEERLLEQGMASEERQIASGGQAHQNGIEHRLMIGDDQDRTGTRNVMPAPTPETVGEGKSGPHRPVSGVVPEPGQPGKSGCRCRDDRAMPLSRRQPGSCVGQNRSAVRCRVHDGCGEGGMGSRCRACSSIRSTTSWGVRCVESIRMASGGCCRGLSVRVESRVSRAWSSLRTVW